MRSLNLKKIAFCGIATTCLFSAIAQSNTAPAQATSFAGPTAEVVKLAQSGVGDDVVVAFINSSTAKYHLSANDIVALKDSGVSPSVLSAMIAHDRGTGGSALPQPAAASSPAPATQNWVPANPAPASNGPSYEQKLYAPSAQASAPGHYAPQPVSPAVPNAPTAPNAPTVANAPVVDAPPPSAPPQVEVVPIAPGPDYYWTPGYWAWRGGGWVWISGAWVHPPRRGAIWVGGHWAHRGHGYIWIGGTWR